MKISLALGPREPLSRQTALGCLTTNLALPGFGSLVAGHAVGYPQAVFGLGGVGLTTIFGARFIYWNLANWARLHGPQADPFAVLGEMWLVGRWALLGIAVFLIGWLWALSTSMQILSEAKRKEQAAVPPRLT